MQIHTVATRSCVRARHLSRSLSGSSRESAADLLGVLLLLLVFMAAAILV